MLSKQNMMKKPKLKCKCPYFILLGKRSVANHISADCHILKVTNIARINDRVRVMFYSPLCRQQLRHSGGDQGFCGAGTIVPAVTLLTLLLRF